MRGTDGAFWVAAAGLLLGCAPDPYPGEAGQVLHLAYQHEVKGFDPVQAAEASANLVVAQVYEGLYAYHPYARPYQVVPAIAAAEAGMSQGGLVARIPLRKGLRFIDDPCFPGGRGREVTAGDVVYSWKRLSHGGINSPGWWVFRGWIQGLDAFHEETTGLSEYDGYERPVDGLRAPDPCTVEIHLTRPYPQLRWVLAMGYTVVYPREAVEHYRGDFPNHPVGTGPFILDRFVWGYKVILRRNPWYREAHHPAPGSYQGWEEDARAGLLEDGGKRIPHLDGIHLSSILEPSTRWLYFQSGYADYTIPPKDNFDEAIVAGEPTDAMRGKGVRLLKVPGEDFFYTGFNTEDVLLRNRDLRRAISLASDTDWRIKHIYNDCALRAHSPVPPGYPGCDPGYRHPYAGPDLARARAFLARAGFPGGRRPDGSRLRLRYELAGPQITFRHAGESFVRDLAQIGIDVELSMNTWPEFIRKVTRKDAQVWRLSWLADYPDTQNFLQLLYSRNASPGPNRTNYSNPEYDRLYDEVLTMPDGPEKSSIIRRMIDISGDDCPWIPRAHRVDYVLYHSWLKNLKYTAMSPHYIRYLRVDPEERRRRTREWNRPHYLACGLLLAGILGGLAATVRFCRKEL